MQYTSNKCDGCLKEILDGAKGYSISKHSFYVRNYPCYTLMGDGIQTHTPKDFCSLKCLYDWILIKDPSVRN